MDIEEKKASLMAGVGNFAKERFIGHSGFDALLFYIEGDDLLNFLPEYPGSILQDFTEFVNDFFSYIKSNNLQIKFIKSLLMSAKKNESPDIKAPPLASKILNQMLSDELKQPNYVRRPSYYLAKDKKSNGLAIAVCISDLFWTKNW